ncbi:MAG TPA: glycosyltransferase family 4 protein [Candidatus Dormibacteraeota bacterium]|nr:glycosyltransferase family 4 protein [Candidatus Dormibacteraeota bacterium]
MTRPRVGLLHYTCPPVIGGVETILQEQATRLAARGYPVTVLTGRGGPLADASGIGLVIIPELDSRHPKVSEVREALMQGAVPPLFGQLTARMDALLQPHLAELDVVIVHNALSLHFNLPLTVALWTAAHRARPRLISWMHDLSWVNPLYRPWMHDGEPWDYLRRQHPRITPVFVSLQRMDEWRALTGAAVDAESVIPNGIDPMTLLKLGPGARTLVSTFGLLESDVLLLAPVRITKRKNLEWAIDAAAAIRDAGRSVQLLITGPPGPHNPRSHEYVAELKQHTERLRLQDSVRFLFEATGASGGEYAVDAATLSDLYMLSDVVVLPSASEGFGLPLAEAAVFRAPVVATDLPAFREVASEGATLVPIDAGSAAFTAAVLAAIDSPSARLRRHVLAALSWNRLITERIEPLLAAAT